MPLPPPKAARDTPVILDMKKVLARYMPRQVTSIVPVTNVRNQVHMILRGSPQDVKTVLGQIPAKYAPIKHRIAGTDHHLYFQVPDRP